MRWFALGAVVLLASGCSLGGPSVGGGGTLPTGRSVEAKSDRAYRTVVTDTIGEDTRSIRMGTFLPRKVVVRPGSIELDGVPVAMIPETTKSVAVAEEDGRLHIDADGNRVYEGSF